MATPELDLEELETYNNVFELSERKLLIAETLKALRLEYNLTQKQVANFIGIDNVGTYSTYETGRREAPAEIIVRAAMLYNVPTDYILQRARYQKDVFDFKKQLSMLENGISDMQELLDDKKEMPEDVSQALKEFTNAISVFGDGLKSFGETNKNNSDE